MRASSVTIAVLAMLLVAPALGGLAREPSPSPWDGLTPGDRYGTAPNVTFHAPEIVQGTNGTLTVWVTNEGTASADELRDLTLDLEVYSRQLFGEVVPYSALVGDRPAFYRFDEPTNATVTSANHRAQTGALGPRSTWTVEVNVTAPAAAPWGIFFVRLSLTFNEASGKAHSAMSEGHFDAQTWSRLVADALAGKDLAPAGAGVDGLLPEAAFVVVTPDLAYVKRPNKVPDFGNYTTPVIRPGSSGTYNFTVTNRYDATITNVAVAVEVYMWATLEEAKALDKLDGPAPKIDDTTGTRTTETLGSIAPGEHADVVVQVRTKEDTPKGTYFVRHRISFTYKGVDYVMASRGHFTTPQWEGFNYTNLAYQLDVAGIVPDSSFSVKDPVPLWPLATLIALCVFFGALAVVFYLAEEHGSEYPRLKKALQYWTGKLEQRRRLVQQRLDELRRELDVPLEDDE